MSRPSQVVDPIVAALQASRTVCVAGHVRPDGDCVGSQLGLALALRQAGKRVTVWNQDPLPDKLAFLDRARLWAEPRPGRRFDCVVAADVATYERLGTVGDCVRRRRVLVNIDHHASNAGYGDLNWLEAQAASTGEMIFHLLERAGWPVTPPIADCLFTAVSTDTGSFQYPTTRPWTFAVAGELVGRGADLGTICQEVYQSCSLPRLRLLRHVLNRIRLHAQQRVAYVWLRPADYLRTGASPADTEGLIDYLRALEPVVVAIVFEELEPALTRISLRSKRPSVNVSALASPFGGGGHPAAAG
ncbi:MAG: bifunctional oligoribonuclease/PAP phosphatase NrnA, partial [Verrucomicrobia bacterium]|nr:bifunctional oligoribonuclease/PAP phosphatase NrnA [Verrucomicrobiota bacterium]